MCTSQGDLLTYLLTFADKHKELRLELTKSDPDKEVIRGILDFMTKHQRLYMSKFFDVLGNARSEIYKPFLSQENIPRICIKLVQPASNDTESDLVFDIKRWGGSASNVRPYDMKKNTGLWSCYSEGIHYFCNNIPKTFKKGQYENPRLIASMVKDYNSLKPKNFFKKWNSCWKSQKNKEIENQSCYKSTVIIPITLLNNRVGLDIQNTLNIANLNNSDTLVMGMICFDHVRKGYFTEQDIDIGYFFADILSLYLYIARNYVEGSGTYLQAQELLAA